MIDDKIRTFLFKCEKCKELLTRDFDNEEDIEEVLEERIWLECPECETKASLLSN